VVALVRRASEFHTFQQLSAGFLLRGTFPVILSRPPAIPTEGAEDRCCFFKYLHMAKGVLSCQADEVARNGAHLR